MTTDREVAQVVLNKLTQAQYDSIETKNPDEFYCVTDAKNNDAFDVNNLFSDCTTKFPNNIKIYLDNRNDYIMDKGTKIWYPDGKDDFGNKKFSYIITNNIFIIYLTLLEQNKIYSSFINIEKLLNNNNIVNDNNIGYYMNHEVSSYNGSTITDTVPQILSQTTAPKDTSCIWYDLSNNYIKTYDTTTKTWGSKWSFPLFDTDNLKNIKNVFDGFGYIGNHLFALPGTEILNPNGRDEDKTIEHNKYTISKVILSSFKVYDIKTTSANCILYNGNLEEMTTTKFPVYKYTFNRFSYSGDQSYCICGYYKTETYDPDNDNITFISDFIIRQKPQALDYTFRFEVDNKLDFKLDKNFSNSTKDTRQYIDNLVSFSYNSPVTLTFKQTLSNDGEEKTMEYSGLFTFSILFASSLYDTVLLYVNDQNVAKFGNDKNSVDARWWTVNFPVHKGDRVKLVKESTATVNAAQIICYLYPRGSSY